MNSTNKAVFTAGESREVMNLTQQKARIERAKQGERDWRQCMQYDRDVKAQNHADAL